MVSDVCKCSGYEIGDYCMAYIDGFVKVGRVVDIFEGGDECLLADPDSGDEFTVDKADILKTDPAVKAAIVKAVRRERVDA